MSLASDLFYVAYMCCTLFLFEADNCSAYLRKFAI